MTFEGYSDPGGKDKNTEACFALQMEKRFLFAVADGACSEADGEMASAFVVYKLKNDFMAQPQLFDLAESVPQTDAALKKLSEKQNKRFGCSFAAVCVDNAKIQCAVAGNCRIYIADVAGSLQMIADEKNGEDGALGGETSFSVEMRTVESASARAVLLCTDGVWTQVPENELCRQMQLSADAGTWICRIGNLVRENACIFDGNHTAVAAMA